VTDSLLLLDVMLVPMDGPAAGPVGAPLGEVRKGAIRIRGDRIEALGELTPAPGERVFDGHGLTALPGFVQGHVHFCQSLFRGFADDLPLLPWLQQRIWPLEHAHDAASARASADLSLCELLRSGTTTVQVMESVRHAEQAFAAALDAGVTAILGNCLMDEPGGGVPAGMATSAPEALRISEQLWREFHGRNGRVFYAVSPRFVLSCSEGLARDAAAFARQCGLRVHTHAGEHPDEVAAVRQQFGTDYVLVLERQGLLGPKTGLAHCVHTTAAERDALRTSGTAVLHCPSTNLKLGSGIAPVAEYRRLGLEVALGADGAACNNRLSALAELRLAALLQNLAAGPGAFPAVAALWTATRGGALALGLDHEVGSLRPGLRADVLLFDLQDPDLAPGGSAASQLVYSATERHLRHVLLGGRFAVRDGALRMLDAGEVAARAARERDRLLARAGLAR
jgi:5-methylthioadenosine/S-adenosylhomocysteine deaminase